MKPRSEIHDVLQAYFSGKATPQQAQALEAWLRTDTANVRLFVDLGLLDGLMLSVQQDEDAAAILATLAEAEANAEPDFSLLHVPAFDTPTSQARDRSITFRQAWSLTGFALKQGLRTKAGTIGSIAAVLVLGAVLCLSIFSSSSSNGKTPDAPEFADQTPTAPEVASTNAHPVATLTATHNAQFGGPASAGLRTGASLTPGTRLTLTAGFAEITTAQGAVAILQAPATIELLDNNNALRLHAGKLVGICETESSKGFLVHTPHMDITDLGTRFGINADADATEVHVFEGKVQAERVDTAPGTEPILLAANQSARTSADTDVITSIDHDADRFAALLPNTTPLPGTGFGLAVGDTDPNWQIVAIDGQPLGTPQTLRVARDGIYAEHFANDPATSQFVAWNPGVEPPVGGAIAYTFRTLIDVPEDIDPANARLVMRYMADNKLQAVVINGNRVEVNGHAFDLAYDRWAHCVIDEYLVTGSNTILLEIHNRRPDQISTVNVGLRLQWELVSKPEALQEINSQP